MRIAPRGSAGWRLRPRKLERQPLFFIYALLVALEASTAPLERDNKKKRSPTHADTSMV